MTHLKYRIPRATTAALLLGGAACGSDDDSPSKGSTEGVDTSRSRIEAVAKAYCEQYEDCFRADFQEEFGTVADCRETIESELATEDNECGDAWLDYLSCATELSCAEIGEENECDKFFRSYAEACGGGDDDDYSSSASGVKRQGPPRKYRIPR